MFSLLGSNLRLIGIGAAVIACLSLAYVVNGWRDDSKALAVERAQYREAVEGFNEQLRQVQENEQIAREASRGYQAQLSALQTESDALRESNRGLRLVAYRAVRPFPATPARLDDPAPEPERDSGTVVDLERLARLATSCQQDAEQLAALQGWILAIGR